MLKKVKYCMESKAPLYAGRCVYACKSGTYWCLCVAVLGFRALELTWGAGEGLSKPLAVQRIKTHCFPETQSIASGKSHNATTCFFMACRTELLLLTSFWRQQLIPEATIIWQHWELHHCWQPLLCRQHFSLVTSGLLWLPGGGCA